MANSPAAARTAPPEFIARFELREEIERDSVTLDVIGLLRVRVWADEEGELDLSSLPNPDSWLDSFDALPRDACRHWTIRERNAPSEPVAAARLTFHPTLDDEPARDLKLWRDVGRALLLPCVDLGRLVVRKSHRRLGLAHVSCRAIASVICRPSSCRLSSCNSCGLWSISSVTHATGAECGANRRRACHGRTHRSGNGQSRQCSPLGSTRIREYWRHSQVFRPTRGRIYRHGTGLVEL